MDQKKHKFSGQTVAQITYDNLSQREDQEDLNEEMADEIEKEIRYTRILVQQKVAETLSKHQAVGVLDPENQMASQSLSKMVESDKEVLKQLEYLQDKVLVFKLGQTKKIGCQYCEHKGRSIVEEQQPRLTIVVILALFLVVRFWCLILVPFVIGLLRKQMHRCPKCLNEIREESVFEALDENIMEISILKFGILVKRRSLLKGLLFTMGCLVCGYFWQNGETSIMEAKDVNQLLTWQRFLWDCGPQVSDMRRQANFETYFIGSVVSWEGTVVRVSGSDKSSDEETWIDSEIIHNLSPAEIIVSMNSRLEYDLVVTLDESHLKRNLKVLEQLHNGTRITFTGYVSDVGFRKVDSEVEWGGVTHLVAFEVKIVN